MIFVCLLLATARVSCTPAPDCPCVPPWKCRTRPYGSHALDIATFGLLPSCPVLGTVRCCPRDGVKEIPTSENMVHQTSRTSFHSKDLDAECECVSPGICLPHFVTASSQCQEFDELCCIPNSDINTAVQLFNTQLMQNDYSEDAHNPTDHGDSIGIDDNLIISEPKPEYYGTGYNTENEAVPCVPGLKCAKLYGFHPLDIARFGTLPHCSQRGLVRCVELKAPTSRQPTFPSFLTHQGGHEAASILPCLPINECSKIYGLDPFDVAKFGVLPLCASHGFARCIQRKHSTESSSSISPTGSSQSTSSFGSYPSTSTSGSFLSSSPSRAGPSPSAPPTESSTSFYQTGSYSSTSPPGSSSSEPPSSSQTGSSPSSPPTESSTSFYQPGSYSSTSPPGSSSSESPSSSQTGSTPSSSPSVNISNSKPMSPTAVEYQTPLNENFPHMQNFPSPDMQDFPSPDMQDFPSPDMQYFPSPDTQDFPSPDMQNFPSPDMQDFPSNIQNFPSPDMQDFPSPDTQDFPSPDTQDFPSPDMQDFPSPDTQDFPSPDMQNFPSPDMQDFPSPDMQDFPSPDMQDFPSNMQDFPSPNMQNFLSSNMQDSQSPNMQDSPSPNMQDFPSPDIQDYPYPDLDIQDFPYPDIHYVPSPDILDYSSTEIQDSTSDIQNTEEHGNSNINERASIVRLEPVTMHEEVEHDGDKEVKEFTPIVLNGNDISGGLNLQVHLPTELIGTDIHKLLNHLALKDGSNVLPGSIETDPDDNLDPSKSYKLENDQLNIKVIKSDNAQPSYFDEYQTDRFEPGINDLSNISKPDNVKHLSESVDPDDVLNNDNIVRTESDTNENETENLAHSESFNSDDDQVQSPESLISTDLSKDESKFIIRDRNEDYWFLSKISNPTNIFQPEDNNRPVNPDILENDERRENSIETDVNNVTNLFSEAVKKVTKPESIDEGTNYVKPENSEHPR